MTKYNRKHSFKFNGLRHCKPSVRVYYMKDKAFCHLILGNIDLHIRKLIQLSNAQSSLHCEFPLSVPLPPFRHPESYNKFCTGYPCKAYSDAARSSYENKMDEKAKLCKTNK